MRRVAASIAVALASGCSGPSSPAVDAAVSPIDAAPIDAAPTPDAAPPAECSNGLDDDCDTLIDFGHDDGCSSTEDGDEWSTLLLVEGLISTAMFGWARAIWRKCATAPM